MIKNNTMFTSSLKTRPVLKGLVQPKIFRNTKGEAEFEVTFITFFSSYIESEC